MDLMRRTIRENTHGDPPIRESFGGSDEKWTGYLLGVEEAADAASDLYRGAVEERERLLHGICDALDPGHPTEPILRALLRGTEHEHHRAGGQ